jgi:hypothetical protein
MKTCDLERPQEVVEEVCVCCDLVIVLPRELAGAMERYEGTECWRNGVMS